MAPSALLLAAVASLMVVFTSGFSPFHRSFIMNQVSSRHKTWHSFPSKSRPNRFYSSVLSSSSSDDTVARNPVNPGFVTSILNSDLTLSPDESFSEDLIALEVRLLKGSNGVNPSGW